MKKFGIALIALIVSGTISAQTRFGIKGGPTLANWIEKFNGEKDEEYKSRTGFHFGAFLDHSLSKNLSIQPHVLFVSKGASIEHEDHTDRAVISAIDIPVNFLYKAPAGSGKIFIGGGPNFGFNLGGTLKSDEEGDEDIEIGSEEGELKGFDFGLNFLAGYELASGLFISANYTPGLTNLIQVPSSVDLTRKSNYFGISLGYMFGGKAAQKK